MEERTCKQCGESKPLQTEFHRQAKALKSGGYRVVCKTCANQYQRDMYKTPEGRAARIASQRAYSHSEHGRQKTADRESSPEARSRRRAYYESRRQQPLQVDGAKTCTRCGTEKTSTEYYAAATGRGGRSAECKTCFIARVGLYSKVHKEKMREYSRTYYHSAKESERRASRRNKPVTTSGTRTCRACSLTLDVQKFPIRRTQNTDGRSAVCTECARARRMAYRRTPEGAALTKKWNDCRDYRRLADSVRNRRARLKDAPGWGVTQEDWQDILTRFGSSCYYCGAEDKELTRDHVEPLNRGGAHEPENIVPACVSCNSAKRTRLLLEWVFVDPDRFAVGKL